MKVVGFIGALVLAGLVLAGCGEGSVSTAADETAIGEQNKKWLEVIAAKDAAATAKIYAEDGAMFPPNAPKVVGRDALQKGWGEFFQIPGMALTFETEKLVVAKGGDVAVDIGAYKFTSGEGASQVTDSGKSVVTWVKRDGKWQVLTDMFSSDSPPPQPAPAASAAPATPDASMSAAPGTPAASTPPATTPAPPTTTPPTPPANP